MFCPPPTDCKNTGKQVGRTYLLKGLCRLQEEALNCWQVENLTVGDPALMTVLGKYRGIVGLLHSTFLFAISLRINN